MSRQRKKSTVTVIVLISLCTIIVFNQYIQNVTAWDDEELLAPIVESTPIIDGNKDSIWNDANTTENDSPALKLYAMIISSYVYILVEVRVVNHDNDEYVKILISNSSDSEPEDFVDAKLIQTRNFSNAETRTNYTVDQYYSGGDYLDDSENNFVGAANVSSAANSYSYYEFELPTTSKNPDFTNDSSISFDSSYAITVEFGDHEEGGTATVQDTDTIILSFEQPEPPDEPVDPYALPMKVISIIVFSIVGVGFVAIAIISYQSRTRL